ncbi:ROK family protein [Bradyrhizobium guangdongense]|uniref:ROK family protein n=1 Tax=Bradyrhizobium guangdongense TaxID=1325090 RepID=A0A410V204_9BRAD|nr:ROK family protein [Bradyrhizobium guangdongense]QAU37719.1 ROK family protein [Bradyrhizobium guangdongense]QOZ58776.1 ROK family protein [Bradyrhizobium guangdongense]GGI19699.1 transcriptional regulator [Bradyrhizobium guangdongense]
MDDELKPTRTSSQARGSNRGRLIEALRRQGPMPRVELARSTGLSFPAISAITSRMMAEELLSETDATTAWPEDGGEDDADGNGRRRGRPAIQLTLNPGFGRIIAVSLRMNLIETLLADFSGSDLAQSRLALETRALDATALCDIVIAQIDSMLEATGTPRHRLLGIGIALQGIVNADTGRHLWSPALSVTDVDLATPIRRTFEVDVVIANDAVPVALALAAAEPALAEGLAATITVGHGVGMGVVVDGEARWGVGASSEIGHVKLAPNGPQCRCGQRGCVEAYLADYALYRDARTIIDLPPATSQQPSEAQMALLRDRARDGDPRLEQLFRQAGNALAEAVAATISVLRPHHVVLAGPGLQAFDMMRDAYQERLEQAVLPWLLKSTAIYVRPSKSAAIVDGMVRRTLRVVDRNYMETAERTRGATVLA